MEDIEEDKRGWSERETSAKSVDIECVGLLERNRRKLFRFFDVHDKVLGQTGVTRQ